MTSPAPDRTAIADLVQRYAALVDDRTFADLGTLFTDDAVLRTPDPPRSLEPCHEFAGRADVLRALGRVATTLRTRHTVDGLVLDGGPGDRTVRGRVVGDAHHLSEAPDGTVIDVLWRVRYDDTYRDVGGWRFARRVLFVDWVEVRPVRQWRDPHGSGRGCQ